MSKKPQRTLAAWDLYAGAGGLSDGLGAFFDVVGAHEQDSDAAASFRASHPSAEVHECDIREVDFRPLEGLDLIAGGPPCQPWSIGGLRRGRDDMRDGIPHFARAIAEARPRAFLMENVAGLARRSASGQLASLLAALSGQATPYEALGIPFHGRLDYSVLAAVLSADHFGVPQSRKRLFVVGFRDPATFSWPSPSHGPAAGNSLKPAETVLGTEPLGEPNPSIVTYARRPSLRPDPYHGHLYNGGGRPIDLRRPAPTLLASMGGNKTPWVDTAGIVPEYHAHLSQGGPPRTGRVLGARRITVEEAAALQSFEPNRAFVGSRSSKYRQIGNAVPPALARAVAGQVVKALES